MDINIWGGDAKLPRTCTVPGDKSISHRAVMLGAIAEGCTEVSGFLTGEDCLSTIECFRAMGIGITLDGTSLTVQGGRLQAPRGVLNVGNSGTTLRLMTGLLSGADFTTVVTGDASIQKRPMKRVVEPLTLMGAKISGDTAPVTIEGRRLNGIRYTLPVASAQVKSAILLAGLNAAGETVIEEPTFCRDHTERMLRYLGAEISAVSVSSNQNGGRIITLRPLTKPLQAKNITVPGDISSAAFLLAAAAILPGAEITIENVGINPTRVGIITVLQNMGAKISIANRRKICGEEVADISAAHSKLRGTVVEDAIIPSLIDEIPIIAAAAMFAEGTTVIKDAKELRVKEVDRIQVTADEFNKFAAGAVTPHEDGMSIRGGLAVTGTTANSCGDHRLAMSLSVIALAAQGKSRVLNADSADISFPGFYELMGIA